MNVFHLLRRTRCLRSSRRPHHRFEQHKALLVARLDVHLHPIYDVVQGRAALLLQRHLLQLLRPIVHIGLPRGQHNKQLVVAAVVAHQSA